MASLQELLARYATANVPAMSLADDSTVLPTGKTTFDTLKALFDKRQSCPTPTSTAPRADGRRMIAICLVIVDDLLHEDIWREWLGSGGTDYAARMFIHAKYPDRIRSAWVREHTLSISHHPEWNSPEVVRAMLSVLDMALSYCDEGQQCQRMVFATESCIPLYSLQQAGERLFASEKSWLDAYHSEMPGLDKYQKAHSFSAPSLTAVIPQTAVWKALPGWVMLTRPHAAEIMALVRRTGGWSKSSSSSSSDCSTDLVDAFGPPGPFREGFGGVHAPEEVFFATMLSLLGYLRKNGSDDVARQSVTFAEWARKGDANPISFTLSQHLLTRICSNTSSVFARKFKKGSADFNTWRRLVLPDADDVNILTTKRALEIDNEKCSENLDQPNKHHKANE